MQEGKRQRPVGARQAHGLAHQEIERRQRVAQGRLRLALEQRGVKEAREKGLFLRRDRTHFLTQGQRDLGRVPVATARETEDPCRQRRRKRRVLAQGGTGRRRVIEQQADVEPAPKQRRRVGAGALDHRLGLCQGADVEQPVDARHQNVARRAGAARRVRLGLQQPTKQRTGRRNSGIGLGVSAAITCSGVADPQSARGSPVASGGNSPTPFRLGAASGVTVIESPVMPRMPSDRFGGGGVSRISMLSDSHGMALRGAGLTSATTAPESMRPPTTRLQKAWRG